MQRPGIEAFCVELVSRTVAWAGRESLRGESSIDFEAVAV